MQMHMNTYVHTYNYTSLHTVIVTIIENEHSKLSLILGQKCLYFT